MKITPLEIRQHTFEKIFRGYNIDEVDNFLSNIAQEWDRVLNESKMLRMQLEIAEKEASKLREIEMTLFKTLKTAEDTSTMITEQANQQGEKYVQEAHTKSENITSEARIKAAEIIKEAEDRAKYIKEEVLGEVKGLERDFKAMDNYKDNLLVQMKSLANATIDHVERFESKFDKEGVEAKFKEATTMIEQDMPVVAVEASPIVEIEPIIVPTKNAEIKTDEIVPIIEELKHNEVENIVNSVEESSESLATEPVENVVNETIEIPHEINQIAVNNEIETPQLVNHLVETPTIDIIPALVEPVSVVATVIPEVEIHRENLKIVEGIGPKIEEILNIAGINTFKDLATTPAYKIKEILANAGSHYASHDPTTWGEQAKLAAENNWGELKALQDRLMGGRPEEVSHEIETIEETPIVEKPILPEPAIEVSKPILQREQITEEMLEKVNKVKAAIRKSMLEKADNASRDNTPLTTVRDVIAKNEGGSFFDNL